MIGALDGAYASEIARLLDAPLRSVQEITKRLEEEQVIVGIPFGRERRFELNPRFVGFKPLQMLTEQIAQSDRDIRDAIERLRTSPRRRDKPL